MFPSVHLTPGFITPRAEFFVPQSIHDVCDTSSSPWLWNSNLHRFVLLVSLSSPKHRRNHRLSLSFLTSSHSPQKDRSLAPSRPVPQPPLEKHSRELYASFCFVFCFPPELKDNYCFVSAILRNNIIPSWNNIIRSWSLSVS